MRWPNTGAPTSIREEKPLTPAARAALVVNAAITILLFYLTAILFMAGFGALALLLLGAAVLAARFGMAAFVARLMRVPVRLLGILGRRLWLSSGTTYRVALMPNDAPGLFEMSRGLSRRSAVGPPEFVSLQIHLKGRGHFCGAPRREGRTGRGHGCH